MSTANTSGAAVERTVNGTVAMLFGAIYVLVGILGFFVSETFAETSDKELLGIFEVNHLHNIVHLAIGVALLLASRRGALARTMNLAIGVTYLAVGVLGFLVEDGEANILALNTPDHFLHLASGAVLTLVALTQDKRGTVRA